MSARESELLLEALDHGVLRHRDGRVIEVNDTLASMFGAEPAGLVGRAVAELIADADGRPLRQPESREPACLRDAGGALRAVALRQISPEILLVVDRARERRLEQEVWRLSQQAAAVPNPDEPLRGEVVGMIEHEVRTAITVVRGYLRMLLSERHGPLTPDQWCFSNEARRATERVLVLLDNLLDLAAGDDGMPVVRKPVRVEDVLRAALDGARPLLEDAGVKAELEIEPRGEELMADPDRLEQVFVNLISNAAGHAPQGSTLSIGTSLAQLADGDFVAITFTDEGPGISEADVERIFQPFVQGHGSIGVASGGVGLGLAICRRIVSLHEGTIDAVPALGYGLFRVMLPLARERG